MFRPPNPTQHQRYVGAGTDQSSTGRSNGTAVARLRSRCVSYHSSSNSRAKCCCTGDMVKVEHLPLGVLVDTCLLLLERGIKAQHGISSVEAFHVCSRQLRWYDRYNVEP